MDPARGSLLVVDDNEMNRNMLARRLTRSGYTVAVAEDGHQALQMTEAQPFDEVATFFQSLFASHGSGNAI